MIHQDYNKILQNDLLYEEPSYSSHYTSTQPGFIVRHWNNCKIRLEKKNIKEWAYKWRWAIYTIVFSLFSGIIMFSYRREFFQTLETLSHKLRDMGFGGYILISFLIFLSAFPPMIGYSTYQTLSGYTFGFAIGFPISYLSGLLGASACFWLSRTYFKDRVAHLLSNYPNIEAAVKAIERKGFKLFVLIRLSPYPFNLLNFLSAASSIPFSHFVAGTAISLLKIALHVYIGANLTSFMKHVLGEEEKDDMSNGEIHTERVKFIAAIFGTILSFGVMAYLYKITKDAIKEANSDEEEMQGFLSAHDESDD